MESEPTHEVVLSPPGRGRGGFEQIPYQQIKSVLMASLHGEKLPKKFKERVDKAQKDYSNDPFFIKKRELSLKLIQKAGLPESFIKRS